MIFWAGVLLMLLVFAWALAWGPRGSLAPAAKGGPAKPAPPGDPGAKTQPPAARRGSVRDEPEVPSFAEDDDDIEVTVVTASPVTVPPPSEDPAGGERAPTDESNEPASKIELIYEDEAEGEEITSPIARILVSAEGQSDGGKVRRRNEDSFLVLPERSLFVVADGMGGHAGGDVASALAVETLRGAFERNIFDGKTESDKPVPRRGREMARAIQMANHAILQRASTNPELKQMGTTVVAARFSPNKQRVYVGHVGDSRCYRVRRGVMRQLTTDHTMEALGLKGPGAQHLYQAVGFKPRITIDVVVDKPRTDDVYLLCSDGLSKMAKDDEVREILVDEPDLEAAVYALIELANDRGGKDNVTVILVKVVERPMTSAPI
jgi:serine/threonine protein phosphatase PrpC